MPNRQLKTLNRKTDVSYEQPTLRVDDRSITDTAFLIGLEDHDQDILNYIKEYIRPSVVQEGNRVDVPVYMGNREAWNAVSNQQIYKDTSGKLNIPIITLNRSNVEPNLEYPSKIDANKPNNYRIFEKGYSKNNPYDNFDVETNIKPVKEYIAVPMPDYIIITYSGIIQTHFSRQMNHLVESFLYATNTYWGQFKTKVSGFDNTSEVVIEEERIITNEFTLTVWGNLVPNVEQSKTNLRTDFSPAIIKFKPIIS